MTDSELIMLQKQATYSLVLQGIILTTISTAICLPMFASPYVRLEHVLLLFMYFGGYGIIPLALGIALYRGQYSKNGLEGWMALSLLLGIGNLVFNLASNLLLARSRWSPIIAVMVTYSLLIPVLMLHRLTKYYSIRIAEAEVVEEAISIEI